MRVYRVEQGRNGSGEGPFQTDAIYGTCMGKAHSATQFPSMRHDFQWLDGRVDGNWYCACPCIAALLYWFPVPCLLELMEEEHFVHVYEVEDVAIGHSMIQVAFHKRSAKLVEVWTPEQLLHRISFYKRGKA